MVDKTLSNLDSVAVNKKKNFCRTKRLLVLCHLRCLIQNYHDNFINNNMRSESSQLIFVAHSFAINTKIRPSKLKETFRFSRKHNNCKWITQTCKSNTRTYNIKRRVSEAQRQSVIQNLDIRCEEHVSASSYKDFINSIYH